MELLSLLCNWGTGVDSGYVFTRVRQGLQQEVDLNQRSLELLEERMKGSEAAQLAAALEATQAEAAQAAEALEGAKQKQKEMRELAKVGAWWGGERPLIWHCL